MSVQGRVRPLFDPRRTGRGTIWRLFMLEALEGMEVRTFEDVMLYPPPPQGKKEDGGDREETNDSSPTPSRDEDDKKKG